VEDSEIATEEAPAIEAPTDDSGDK